MHPCQTRRHAAVWVAVLIALLTGCGGGSQRVGGAPSTAPPTSALAPPTAETQTGASSWSMPNLVGSNLQDAQDAIQRLTGGTIFFTTSHDATGAGRNQVLDRNWKVCSQSVPAGSTITAGNQIDFGAVKLDERCSTAS